MWPLYWKTLQQLPSSTSFFVSTTFDKTDAVKLLLQKDLQNAQFFGFENRGRDFGALMSLLNLVPLNQFDLVLKIHTGNTDYYSDSSNERWLLDLIGNLLPNGRLNALLNYFKQNPNVGIAGPGGNHWPLKKLFYNENTINHWNKLTANRKPEHFPEEPFFIAGGMFWARGSIFKGFSDLKIPQSQFEEDGAELDGTLSHALERFVSLIAHDQSLTTDGFEISDFSNWLSQRTITSAQKMQFERFISISQYQPTIQVIIKCHSNFEPQDLSLTLQSIQVASICGIKVRAEAWDESSSNHLASFANSIIYKNGCDFLLCVKAGDEFSACGLLMAYVEMIKQPDVQAFYTDKMLRNLGGSIETSFLPDFNHDLLVSFPWLMTNHWLFKCDTLKSLGGFDEIRGSFVELAFILKMIAAVDTAHIHHIAEPLLITLEPNAWTEEPQEKALIEKYVIESGYANGQVLQLSPRLYRALYLQAETPLVSIIIPNFDINITQRCLESLLQNTGYSHYEILIVDNNSQDLLTLNWLEGIGAIDPQKFRIVFNDGMPSIYAMNNAGSRDALGKFLVFVDSSVQFIESSWLDALVIHGQRPKAGAVGVKLVESDLKVCNAGYVLGMKPGNEHAFIGERFDDIGYLQRLSVDQNYSAVSSKCMMIQSKAFESVGGFDLELTDNTEIDVDFCLKIKVLGLDNIWTPHAVVQWNGETTSNNIAPPARNSNSDKFLSAWLPSIANDPSYNKNLSYVTHPYRVEPLHELSWQPLTWRPQPVILAHPSDDTGCGHYRVMQPLKAMMNEGLAEGVISFRHLLASELERINPDSIIFQRPLEREFLDYMKHSKTYSSAFKIYELDDLITNIPIKNYFKSKHPKDTVKLLREGIAQVDRFIVSTPGLAEAYSGWHSDMQVLELKLPAAWWGNLKVTRAEHKKPRVGWAGGSSHLGDLELIADVVKELAGEVDWIFFGMCPSKLRPYVKEFHSGVPIHMYPQKLASLDLDIALAPLENNQFNDCKSNLRLLEYGACGYPVICSNTRAFIESNLPVRVTKNKYKDWTESIRALTQDINETRKAGEILHDAVKRKWMLDDMSNKKWITKWSPSNH